MKRAFGRMVLRLLGWRFVGRFPDVPKLVVIAAPHSSGWDFVIAIAAILSLGMQIRFLGKAELFKGPLGWILRRLGGIPVRRDDPDNVVERVVDEFRRADRLVLGIAPEGTRRPGARWKTGFYRIAAQAEVPIVPGYLDWSRKEVGVLAPFIPTGDQAGDLAAIQALYAGTARKDGRRLQSVG